MRTFVTGGYGFVGTWLRSHLQENGDVVVAPMGLDVRDRSGVAAAMGEADPEAVFHLAARTAPTLAEVDRADTLEVNVEGTRAVIDAALALRRPPVVVSISSATVYLSSSDPLGEDAPTGASGMYAISKLMAEAVCEEAAQEGLRVIVCRTFNHFGPGQSEDFVVSALAARIVRARKVLASSVPIGRRDVIRDFTDVRDVVRAYRLLTTAGAPGVYNVCSGEGRSVAELCRSVMEAAEAKGLQLEEEAHLTRERDADRLVGDPEKLRSATGWRPEIAWKTSISDVVAWWSRAIEAPS